MKYAIIATDYFVQSDIVRERNTGRIYDRTKYPVGTGSKRELRILMNNPG